eukprot:CAMPEP_0114520500 /NCGR_PEP_ID=MMETSP0109-20121206/19609_1 /TAXON_ID=29199 /ORGANISM="Chlorarachnion reptans, Strain CCCM449" /LENGTH=58 /DNA_ID=CAMNT_0001701389 /DNA_START=315 /DNA_END=487 /DNA_ORIENTATION=+
MKLINHEITRPLPYVSGPGVHELAKPGAGPPPKRARARPATLRPAAPRWGSLQAGRRS